MNPLFSICYILPFKKKDCVSPSHLKYTSLAEAWLEQT